MHGVPTGNVSTVLMTVTADATSSSAGFLSVWASGEPLPGTISLTYYPNEDTSNLVMAKVGTDGNIMVTNYTGITHLVIDIVGYFSTDLNSTPTSSSTSSTSTSTSSTTSTTMGLGRPSQVQGVAAFTQSSRTIAVHWDSAPASEQVTAFRISPSPACSSCGGLTAGVTNSSTVTGLRPGTEYVFRVIATNAAGDSDPSTVTVASRATTFAEAPSAPTEVNATAGHSKVTVSWSEPDELNGSRLLGYTVIVSPDCPCSGTIVDPAVTESVITGLTDGEQYTFTVQASSDSGTSISTDFDVATPVPLLRVMTWNIKRGMESEGPTSDGEPGRFASEIAAQHADVVGFQEITETQAERIAQLLGWGPPHWIETKDPEVEVEPGEELCFEQILLRCRQFGNAIISRYPLEEIDFWRLPVAAVEEGLERRALLRAVVTLVGGFRVHLYDTHLASGSPEESNTDRNRQALAIVDRVNTDRSGEGHRAVLLGDLNSKPGDPTLEPPFPPDPAITTLNGPLQDAWTAVYPDPNTRPPGYTSTPTNPHQRIDYVFNDRSSPVPVEGAQVGTSIGLSDHHWLWADL